MNEHTAQKASGASHSDCRKTTVKCPSSYYIELLSSEI